MPASDKYRQLSEECYRLANVAKTETGRLALLDRAVAWRKASSPEHEMSPERPANPQHLEPPKAQRDKLKYVGFGGCWDSLVSIHCTDDGESGPPFSAQAIQIASLESWSLGASNP